MSKVALCVERVHVENLLKDKLPNGKLDMNTSIRLLNNNDQQLAARFYSLPTTLMDRDICEHDSSYLQLIPYIVLLCVTDNRLQVVKYRRGDKSTEKRLRNCSIGFGGHIEEYPETSLCETIVKAAGRELQEEVGVEVDEDNEQKYIQALQKETLLIYAHDDVGQHHLGVLMLMQILPEEIQHGLEVGQIDELEIVDFDKLGQFKLEDWSSIAATVISVLFSRVATGPKGEQVTIP